MPKSASFDVLGTCFHFQPVIAHLSTIISRHSSPIDATSFFYSWFYAAQRDFTYLSMVGSYTPIASVLKSTLRRAFSIVGFPNPASNITDDDIAETMKLMTQLPARERLKELFDGLRREGWEVYAVTNGAHKASMKYFELAGIELAPDHLLSCDDIGDRGVAKPDLRVYENANAHLEKMGAEKGERWFVAAHSWDLVAARKAGFKTAWVAHEEGDAVSGLFGKADVEVQSLSDLLEAMQKAA